MKKINTVIATASLTLAYFIYAWSANNFDTSRPSSFSDLTGTVGNAAVDGTSITKQGNTFNSADQLARLSASGALNIIGSTVTISRLGISTPTPTALLHVTEIGNAAQANFEGAGVTGAAINLNITNGGKQSWTLQVGGAGNVNLGEGSIGFFENTINGEPNLLISSNGKVQIGYRNTGLGTGGASANLSIRGNVGIGTFTAVSQFSVVGLSVFDGHHEFEGVAPTLFDCGATPSIVGNDSVGKITIGTGGTASICNLKFASSWTNAPSCFCNNESQVLLVRSSATTTHFGCSASVAFGASDIVNYRCDGRR